MTTGLALGEPGHLILVASLQLYLDMKHKQKLGHEPQETESAWSLWEHGWGQLVEEASGVAQLHSGDR